MCETTPVTGSYGILFGLSDDWTQFYTFGIDSSGGYAIWKTDQSNWTLLATGLSESIHPGITTNKLNIERNGALIRAYANGQLLDTLNQGDFTDLRHVVLIAPSAHQPSTAIKSGRHKPIARIWSAK